MYKLGERSLKNINGVNPNLIKVVKRAIEITQIDFAVTEGLRNEKRQKHLVKIGASQTLISKHLTGDAVDLVAYDEGSFSWDWPLYHKIAEAMKQAAYELDVAIVWGGDWKSFKDGPHFQLNE